MKKKALKTSPLLAKMLAKSGDEATKTITTIQQHVASFKLEIKDAIGLHQAGQLQAAAAKYQQLLKADLDENQQARVLSLLATTLLQQQQFHDAAQTFQAALKLNPHDASTHNNLGVCLKQLGNKALAIKHFKQAVDLDGNYADALNNYAAALIDERQQLEAISYLDQAIAIKPEYADSHYNRGTALQSLKRFDEAEESFQRALAINPQFISALFNSGLLRLLRGEFEQGWRLYEYRWQDVQAKQYVHNFSQPLWLGDADLSGKTIYLYAEQGLGDFIQFSRYALMVEKMAAKVILLVPAELMSLATSLSKNIVYIQRKGTETAIDLAFDYHCPILSLPLAFKTDITSIPANVPYLEVPIDKKKSWLAKLPQSSMKKIGLVWSGAAGHLNDANRSIQLTELALALPESAEYHVLQKDIRASDKSALDALSKTHRIYLHGTDLTDFSETGALIEAMDLVVSVDTSVAHLAGALAKPLWILVPFFPDFRWLLDREDSPWYPTARIFRQSAVNDWSSALTQLNVALKVFINSTQKKHFDTENLRANINAALALHQSGKLVEAESQYLHILESWPNHTEVITLLASLYLQQNNYEHSRILFEKSLALDKSQVLALHNYALLLEKLDRNIEAIQYLDAALSIYPQYEDAYKHKANLLKKTNQPEEMLACYAKALQQIPQSAELHFRYANELRDAGKLEQALTVIDQAIKLKPQFAQAYNNRGNILLDLKKAEAALASYQQAIAINPRYANAFNNAANAYLALNQFDKAIESCDAALQIDPHLLTALNNRANALQKIKRFDEALIAYERVINEYKDYSFAPLNKGLLCLLLGNFSEGWALYEARWNAAPQPRLMEMFKRPLWSGNQSIAGKTILLHAEQGFGDTIQFCRYAVMVAALGAKKVYLNIPQPLFNLIHDSFEQWPEASEIKVLTDGDSIPQFDYQTPLMSLPLAFKTELKSIPAQIPYLFASEILSKKWQGILGARSKPRIGIVWSGSSVYTNDSNRSISLQLFASVLDLDYEFHSLQKDIKAEDQPVFDKLNIINHQEQLINFAETAALIQQMDLVISVDTSVAHLAGALGKQVWILLPYVPDFRWLLNRDDSPWYPTAKLYRQEISSDWETLLARVRQDLTIFLSNN